MSVMVGGYRIQIAFVKGSHSFVLSACGAYFVKGAAIRKRRRKGMTKGH